MLSLMANNALVSQVGSFEVGSAKHIRAIIECSDLAELGTRELVEYFRTKNSQADCSGIKADSIRHLIGLGCYPMLTKADGKPYGPKSIADKVKQGHFVLDAWGTRCLAFAFALERAIERAMPADKKSSRANATVNTQTSEKSEKQTDPQAVTSTKIVNQPAESVRSQLAAKLAKLHELTTDNQELHALVSECMSLLPKV